MTIHLLYRKFICVAFVFWVSFLSFPAKSADGPVVVLVNGFGDCCMQRMTGLIDELKAMGAEFPAVAKRGLDGSLYEHYVVPWNSFNALDQGFKVALDPMQYAREALAKSGAAGALGAAANPASMASNQGMIDNVMAAVRKGSDAKFVKELGEYLSTVSPERPVILIGHSFGGDSVLEAAKKINRPILFLGALDPVGGGGLRKLDLGREVPASVKYFYNRWQGNSLFPFDYFADGPFKNCKAGVKCDQQKLNSATGGGKLGHVDFPSDPGLQKEILDIIRAQLGKGAAASSGGATSGTAPAPAPVTSSPLPTAPTGSGATNMLKDQVAPAPLKGLLGR